MAHESLNRVEDIQGSSNRAFGFVFTTFFAIVAVLPWAFGGSLRIWALVVAGLFLFVALAAPAALTPLNRVWVKFGLLLHRVVSPIILGVMFFLVITPIGLVMRLLGKDPLRLQFHRSAGTYWITREPPGPAPQSLKDQF